MKPTFDTTNEFLKKLETFSKVLRFGTFIYLFGDTVCHTEWHRLSDMGYDVLKWYNTLSQKRKQNFYYQMLNKEDICTKKFARQYCDTVPDMVKGDGGLYFEN